MSFKTTHHRIHEDDCKVVVLSDLHKYSGVSNFSKGDNPFFEIYYQLYQESGGTIDKPLGDLTKDDQRAVEQEVEQRCTPAQIKERINHLTPEEKKALKDHYDADGAWERRQEVFESFKTATHVVLNGDIFDIECCKKPEEKIKEAVQWLKDRMDNTPDTNFHFVLGNHETFIPFIKAMHALEQDEHYGKQFHFHEHYFQLNDSLFVHGDEYLGVAKYIKAYTKQKECAAALNNNDAAPPSIEIKSIEHHRRRQLSELKRPARAAYEWFNGIYHKTQNVWHGVTNMVDMIYTKLEASDTEGLSSAFKESNHVFSGHTHQPYKVHYKDKYFYNTGAAVVSRFAKFGPLHIEIENGITRRVEPLLQKDREKNPQRSLVPLNGPTKKYFVTSDLHLWGDQTSNYDSLYDDPEQSELRRDVNAAMQQADVIVLNGDIFELQYTRDVKKTAADSIEWLKKIMQTYPEKEIHFVLGNHEALDDFIAQAKALQSNRFFFHDHAYQPNEKTVFFHGDEVMSGAYVERPIYNVKTAKASLVGRTLNFRGERPAMPIVEWRRGAEKLVPLLSSAITNLPEVEHPEKIENIFIGHTHVPFIDHPCQGRWVTNTGALTNHARFAAVTFDMDMNGTITTPRMIDHSVPLDAVSIRGF